MSESASFSFTELNSIPFSSAAKVTAGRTGLPAREASTAQAGLGLRCGAHSLRPSVALPFAVFPSMHFLNSAFTPSREGLRIADQQDAARGSTI